MNTQEWLGTYGLVAMNSTDDRGIDILVKITNEIKCHLEPQELKLNPSKEQTMGLIKAKLHL